MGWGGGVDMDIEVEGKVGKKREMKKLPSNRMITDAVTDGGATHYYRSSDRYT